MFFLPILQDFKNWVSKETLGKCQNAQNVFSAKYAAPIETKISSLANILGQMVRISQEFIIIFIKNLLNNTTLCDFLNHNFIL